MYSKDDFWLQPSKGFGVYYPIVSETDLSKKEMELGITLPSLYKHFMLQQNGGRVRRSSFFDGNRYHQLFVNDGTLNPLESVCDITEIVGGYMSEKDIDEVKKHSGPCNLDRLVILSDMDGHGVVCLDYGWLQHDLFPIPAVVVLEEDDNGIFGYSEMLRIADFDTLVAGLVYFGSSCERYFLGLSSRLTISEIAEALSEVSGVALKRRDNDWYGRFNFDEYFSGSAESFHASLVLNIMLSPNQHRSGTYLFQNKPEIDFILQVEPRETIYATVSADISDSMIQMAGLLEEKIDCSTTKLLHPHPFDW